MIRILPSVILVIILCFSACKHYKPLEVSQEQLLQNEAFVKHIHEMDYYVHAPDKVIRLKGVSIKESGIHGKIDTIFRDPAVVTSLRNPERKEMKVHKHDINIYTVNDPLNQLVSNDTNINAVIEQTELHLTNNNIESIAGYTVDKKKTFTESALIILIIVLAALLITGLTILIAQSSANASAGSSNSGDSGSGDSAAASGESAAASGTSSGASSGSDSSGGCYIATMVYGSYETPEVLVLRQFRDQTLAKYVWGRSFIQWYYRTSPGFVERNKHKGYIHRLFRPVLNLFVWLVK